VVGITLCINQLVVCHIFPRLCRFLYPLMICRCLNRCAGALGVLDRQGRPLPHLLNQLAHGSAKPLLVRKNNDDGLSGLVQHLALGRAATDVQHEPGQHTPHAGSN
jgi:hypothetical protein